MIGNGVKLGESMHGEEKSVCRAGKLKMNFGCLQGGFLVISLVGGGGA